MMLIYCEIIYREKKALLPSFPHNQFRKKKSVPFRNLANIIRGALVNVII